jgi:hypothetical protein
MVAAVRDLVSPHRSERLYNKLICEENAEMIRFEVTAAVLFQLKKYSCVNCPRYY